MWYRPLEQIRALALALALEKVQVLALEQMQALAL
jgi:hypothetical protein